MQGLFCLDSQVSAQVVLQNATEEFSMSLEIVFVSRSEAHAQRIDFSDATGGASSIIHYREHSPLFRHSIIPFTRSSDHFAPLKAWAFAFCFPVATQSDSTVPYESATSDMWRTLALALPPSFSYHAQDHAAYLMLTYELCRVGTLGRDRTR